MVDPIKFVAVSTSCSDDAIALRGSHAMFNWRLKLWTVLLPIFVLCHIFSGNACYVPDDFLAYIARFIFAVFERFLFSDWSHEAGLY